MGASLEIDATICDADGRSVQLWPVQMGPKTTAAGACAAIQHHVDTLAKALHARGEAAHAVQADDPEAHEEALHALVGQTFVGSVAQ